MGTLTFVQFVSPKQQSQTDSESFTQTLTISFQCLWRQQYIDLARNASLTPPTHACKVYEVLVRMVIVTWMGDPSVLLNPSSVESALPELEEAGLGEVKDCCVKAVVSWVKDVAEKAAEIPKFNLERVGLN
ncbi:hypothetical protein GYMLUDRAFT_689167 [Collybiopsis luxurians FD-317 M1]|uniref:Uncharacterized protein n=1 Tax=Collybiopsis luxurians FD-317 M1 TaxID=944289 RepID=A0A0D0C880_9AGAR|nr:hypothetical protein GYMLUDRAFT_689167 [Collybiopsis luxurians FD-317 M1]